MNLYPYADWWTVEDNPPASLNPTAAIAGLLLKHGVQHPWIESASQYGGWPISWGAISPAVEA